MSIYYALLLYFSFISEKKKILIISTVYTTCHYIFYARFIYYLGLHNFGLVSRLVLSSLSIVRDVGYLLFPLPFARLRWYILRINPGSLLYNLCKVACLFLNFKW